MLSHNGVLGRLSRPDVGTCTNVQVPSLLKSGNIVVYPSVIIRKVDRSMITDYQQVVPTQFRCIAYLQWVEQAFDVSLKFWIQIDRPSGSYKPIALYCAGSGEIFDLLSPREGVVKSPILTADNGSVYPAMWACLTVLENALTTLGRPKVARPPL